jgi:outer membrane protein TolC
MNRQIRPLCVWLLTISTLAGCRPSQPFYFFEDGDLSHYQDRATQIELADVDVPSLDEVQNVITPHTIGEQQIEEFWDLSLQEVVRLSLENSKVFRQISGQVLNSPTQLTASPGAAQTIYNPAITETDPRFGPEAALSAFDAQFSSSVFWENNDRPVNLAFPNLLARELRQDRSTFQAAITKNTATGGTTTVRQNTAYDWNNNPSNLFPSNWDMNVETEFRHPLLQGAGVDYNRIAGPTGASGFQASSPGFFNGVSIARTNVDIALADFETTVRNFTADIETTYWELYFAYRNLEAAKDFRDAALDSYRLTQVKFDQGEADQLALSRSKNEFFLARSEVEAAQANLYQTESQLRYVMGIAPTDERLIRPSEEPTNAPVRFDWSEIHTEALSRSVELRRQKWVIKQDELRLQASKNFLLPRLDMVALYRWRGFGDHLAGSADGQNPSFDSALETMTGGDYQEWQMGLQALVPIGFRQQLAGVRNAQLSLTRDRAVYQEQELEVSKQLRDAYSNLDRFYINSLTRHQQRTTSQVELAAAKIRYDLNQDPQAASTILDQMLQAQRRLSEAQRQYYRAITDYSLAIRDVHLRKGSLLEYNGVYLAEGPWPQKAYFDAKKRARERDAGLFIDYGYTRPAVMSRGEMPQYGTDQPGTPGATPAQKKAMELPPPAGESDDGGDEMMDEPGVTYQPRARRTTTSSNITRRGTHESYATQSNPRPGAVAAIGSGSER